MESESQVRTDHRPGGVIAPGERLELIDGLLLVREPQTSAHFSAVRLATLALGRAFGPGWEVRAQGPIALDDDSEPADVAVVRGAPRDYVDAHPLHRARGGARQPGLGPQLPSSSLYARRLHQYWIVNLVDRALEDHGIRHPPGGAVRMGLPHTRGAGGGGLGDAARRSGDFYCRPGSLALVSEWEAPCATLPADL